MKGRPVATRLRSLRQQSGAIANNSRRHRWLERSVMRGRMPRGHFVCRRAASGEGAHFGAVRFPTSRSIGLDSLSPSSFPSLILSHHDARPFAFLVF